MTNVHIEPSVSGNETTHVIGAECWCQPVIDYADPVTGGRVFVHRRYLDGNAYESAMIDPRGNLFTNPDVDDGTDTHEENEP